MISEDVRARIRRLYFAEHWKIGTIAAELGLHRDTVACAVDTSRFSNCRFRGQSLILDPYRDFVRTTLEQYPRLRATRLLEMIRDKLNLDGLVAAAIEASAKARLRRAEPPAQ